MSELIASFDVLTGSVSSRGASRSGRFRLAGMTRVLAEVLRILETGVRFVR